tara:strand:+ start:54 stop:656 length:603 start_codon:yes stop_codon:yes gene_type:complete
MFSVIIPTMWRSERIFEMLPLLETNDHVAEIIVIDNDKESRPDLPEFEKLRLLEQEENIYVNPAWNLGVEESKEDAICLLSDDVTIDLFCLPIMLEKLGEGRCFGIHPESYLFRKEEAVVSVGHYIGTGWGCCIFVYKEGWSPIPEELKIWCGDQWIVNTSKEVYSITMPVETEMSTTVNSSIQLMEICNRDVRAWQKYA